MVALTVAKSPAAIVGISSVSHVISQPEGGIESRAT